MKYLLGIDFGGGASKATLLDTVGNIIADNTVEYETLHPFAAACEQSPVDWIDALCKNIKALFQKSKVNAEDILSVCIDSATHTFLFCDKDFKPIYNAVHWTDTRSRKQADYLRKEYGEGIFKKTFHKPDTIWTLPQLLWFKENKPTLFNKAKYIFFEKDYIRYFLIGVYCKDYIEAQGSMLFNCEKMQWDSTLCDIAGISFKMQSQMRL